MGWKTTDEYFSGQGVLLVGVRGADGKPRGLRPLGNVPELKLSTAVTTEEHKESTSGQRGTDLRLTKETKVTAMFVLENMNTENLALLTRGESVIMPATAHTDVVLVGWLGLVTALTGVNITAVAVKVGATALTPYINASTPYDYEVNSVSGSIKLADAGMADKLAASVTAVAVGSTTVLTVGSVPTSLMAGDRLYLKGFAGTDATDVNGKWFTVLGKTATTITIEYNSTSKTLTTTAAKVVFEANDILVSYTTPEYSVINPLTKAASGYVLRFEGLNTAQENSAVTVDVFNFSPDPLKELSLIADAVQKASIDGSVLSDTTRTSGSNYYQITKA